jgi:hypothetical protein
MLLADRRPTIHLMAVDHYFCQLSTNGGRQFKVVVKNTQVEIKQDLTVILNFLLPAKQIYNSKSLTQHRSPNTGHQTSVIGHQTPDISHQTSVISHQTSHIGHPTPNIGHPTSVIKHRSSVTQHRTSHIPHPTPVTQHRTSHIRHTTSITLTYQYLKIVKIIL